MTLRVVFTYHAVQRMNQRFNMRVNTNTEVDIGDTFMPIGSAKVHKDTGELYQAYIPRDLSQRIVMLIWVKSRTVMTVMSSGPIVDSVYQQAQTQRAH